VIRTEHLSRQYGPKVALSDLNLRVDPGEILGFLGPNGAGKSTTVKILTGMIRPTSGRASVAGYDIVDQPLEAKKRIGYVPETAALYDGLTAAEYLDLVSALHHLDRKTAATRSGELLELFGLASERHQRLSEFSKGMRQKVLIAASLIHRPEVLFLDEPLDGLDANAALDGTSVAIREQTGTGTLEEAFSRLTGVRDVERVAADFISALERS
jgi:ABC-2 type transport system ATP-binding protein